MEPQQSQEDREPNSHQGSTPRLIQTLADYLEVRSLQVILILLGLLASLSAWLAAGSGPMMRSRLAIPLWIAGILLTTLGCWKRDAKKPSTPWTGWELFGVLILFLISFVIRAVNVSTQPFVLSGDEGSAGLVGWEFVNGSRDNVLSLGWFSFPSLYFWLISLSQSIFGRSIEAIRWVSALGGALGVVALYWSARALFGRWIAFWAAVWLSTFHVHVFFSRVAYNNIWDGVFFTILIGAIWIGWEEGRRSSFIWAGLALGLSQFFYSTSRFIPIILVLWMIILSLHKRPKRAQISGLLSTLIVAFGVALPLALLYLSDIESLFFTASRVSILVPEWTAEAAKALGTTPLGLVLEQAWITWLGLFIAELQGVYFNPGVPMLFGISAILAVLGIAICFRRIRDPRYDLPLITLLITLVIGGLSIQAPNAQRMLLLPPILALLVAFPLNEIAEWTKSRWPKTKVIVPFLLTVLILVSSVENANHLFLEYFPEETYGSVHGEVTFKMLEVLQEEGNDAKIYFIGGERMYFDSIPSLAYLNPDARGEDLAYPYDISHLDRNEKRVFIVLPEFQEAITAIASSLEQATVRPRYNRHGKLLFYMIIG